MGLYGWKPNNSRMAVMHSYLDRQASYSGHTRWSREKTQGNRALAPSVSNNSFMQKTDLAV
jgi:hypothetical protein